MEPIPAGALLSDYSGELTTEKESELRERKAYGGAGLKYTW